ncbi:TIGR02757 family protein [Borrelia puertoricensis]|uniref:TIGR02757 family protein n=1 Tax=Borrelia puertoricensis TaxID=2756107 RepID=UPI001FF53C61|nr:TIGR02757 family protein [Borrelia puertoricensis]UPA18007.1 TIGR02757 family protein [Borrelia puertoricensis]
MQKNKDTTLNILEWIYNKYNKRKFVHPDPLEFLYKYTEKEDIELAGLISSSLALGRVERILTAIESVLKPLGNKPSETLKTLKKEELDTIYKDFTYRFFKTEDIVRLLMSFKKVKEKYLTIENLLHNIYKKNKNFISSLNDLITQMENINGHPFGIILPKPSRGSACKRLFLFLRWMIRKDDVDLGIWNKFSPSNLIVPMDTHMTNISSKLFNLKNKKNVSIKKAIEVTKHFAKENKDDPVKYDFSLTRFGINREFNKEELFTNIFKL